jgi:chemotaxis protein MotB
MRRRVTEEKVHHERWLVSYADFMTLLFALFVVLFATSRHDKVKILDLSSAIRGGFRQLGAFSGDGGVPDLSTSGASIGADTSAPFGIDKAKQPAAMGSSGIDYIELQRKLHKALGKEIERQEVVMQMTPEGFVISLRELGFFNSGEAHLLPGAAEKIERISAILMQYGLDMRVEGHSDNVPIHNATFGSNWDLSTARAMAVAMMLLNSSGFDPKRLSIAGYGEYHPAASNDTPEGRKTNRRVDLVVVCVDKPVAARAH